ncbi:sushi, von Willebrand factor type A, EGF and pentraxin domain-containing protein 1-like isoform X2 [Neocloeon triangulifer]|uniref:sushi, von Willebrand factor type A, EGF and pentraxin domain-containing protein 1-like isoform X2 n=1 Tax=Neocloeon triangulifer TaxID=2078957 RepID=UPI00286F08DF|nr:sushi, von Willebrand factor type A, EGF and pentraxin domain-containing protein 1-like isoform X2 [Neocloeon triangulifer]
MKISLYRMARGTERASRKMDRFTLGELQPSRTAFVVRYVSREQQYANRRHVSKRTMKQISLVTLFVFTFCLLSVTESLADKVSSQIINSDEEDVTQEADEPRIYKNPRNSPSSLCPRDEEQAELYNQKCLRKCSSDEDCKSKKKKCLCDGACGMSCIKPDRECDEVGPPSMGFVRITGRLFGERAIYTCQDEWNLVGLQERTCQADGQWSGEAPICSKETVFCGEAPRIEFARHTAPVDQLSFAVDTTLQYHCQPGYATTGFPHAKCLNLDRNATWFGPDITCDPRTCGPPLGTENGWIEGDCYTYSCRISYHCAVGYELQGGRPERVCQNDGSWYPKEVPMCVRTPCFSCSPAVQCPTPENPTNGKAIYTSCAYNSVVSYECKQGFRLIGDSTRRCGPDRQWSGEPPACKQVQICKPEDIDKTKCLPPAKTVKCTSGSCLTEVNCGHPGHLYNGWLEGIEGGTLLGASIIFRCREGMVLEGNSSTVCQMDGTWRYPLPKCLGPCVIPNVHKGRVIRNITQGPVVPHGYRLEVECEPHHEFVPYTSMVTCNNGTWTHIPRCEPARCKQLPKAPRNGMVIAPKTDHNMKARYKCKDGFSLKGNSLSLCNYGNWTGDAPVCMEVYCPFPGYIENGKVMLVGNMGLYDYRPYVRKVTNNKQIMYDCDRGYVLADGPPGATCIGGHWSPKELPRCVPGQHPRLRWNREVRKESAEEVERQLKENNTHSDYLIDYQYDDYHAAVSQQGIPEFTDYGPNDWRNLMQGAQAHSKAVATKTVTSIDKQRKRNRNKSGGTGRQNKNRKNIEKGQKATCESLPVESYIEIQVIKPGQDTNVTNSLGTVVRLECTGGFSPTLGNRTARCVKGNWKPLKPDCVIMNCHVPAVNSGRYTLNGNIVLADAEIKTNQSIILGCNRGYNIQGTSTLHCEHGNWTNSNFPSCHPSPCRLPHFKNGQYLSGYRGGLTIAHGAKIHYQCEPDYTRSPQSSIECSNGELLPAPPSCRLKGSVGSFSSAGAGITRTSGDLAALGAGADKFSGNTPSVTRSKGQPCGPPARVQGSLLYRDGSPIAEGDKSFPGGSEVTFDCIASIMGEKTTWKIVCEDGSWVGRSLNCASPEELIEEENLQNHSCVFRNTEPNLIYFFNDQVISDEVVEFPPGSELVARCNDIGKYSMVGSKLRKCENGEWDGQKPVCFGLNQENEYALEKPPTILFRHQLGPIAQSNDGKLIVYPGTILHMECLWIRRFGTPKWTVSHNYRKYPEGWTEDTGRDSQLEYRLSILHATKDDSGVFTCMTPTRHTHAVEIVVNRVHCPMLAPRPGMTISSQNTRMNSRVLFTCLNGSVLIGHEEITCLPSGNWSAPVPVCESIECGDISTANDPNLRVTILSREVGGKAVFSCAQGFGITGGQESKCLSTGEWSGPLPECSEVQCEPPETPENGYIQGHGVYKAGDLIQFNCNPEFMMEGQPIIACQETGRWSGTVPKCVQACSYPGTAINGRMSSVKFFYKIGETITFTCEDNMELKGAPMLRCLRNGKWSSSIPTCSSRSGH